MQQDRPPDGVGLLVGPGQCDSGGDVLEGGQEDLAQVLGDQELPDVDAGKKDDAHHIGGDAVLASDDAEDQAPDQGLLHQGRDDHAADQHDGLTLLGQVLDRLVVVLGNVQPQEMGEEDEDVVPAVVESRAEDHRLDQLPEPDAPEALPQETVENKEDHTKIDGKIGDIQLQRRQTQAEEAGEVLQPQSQQDHIKGQIAKPAHLLGNGKGGTEGRGSGGCQGNQLLFQWRMVVSPSGTYFQFLRLKC